MLRLKEVASQSETFPKRALEPNESTRGLNGWPNPATTAQCLLLTGRLYWLLGIVTELAVSRPIEIPCRKRQLRVATTFHSNQP